MEKKSTDGLQEIPAPSFDYRFWNGGISLQVIDWIAIDGTGNALAL